MKTRLIAVCCVLALCGCVTDPPRASGSLADGTFYQKIGARQQSPFAPDCPVR